MDIHKYRVDWRLIVDSQEGNCRKCHRAITDYVKSLIEDFPFENYDAEEFGPSESLGQKVNFVCKVWFAEVGKWNGGIEGLTYWLQGLGMPGLAFMNYEIVDLAHEFVERKNWTEEFEDWFCECWFRFVADELGGLFRLYYLAEE